MEQDVQKPSGKLESLPKDELLKFIKRQAMSSKDLKKKLKDLEDALNKEKQEVVALELEKKEWISRGVSAELEEKEKDDLMKKITDLEDALNKEKEEKVSLELEKKEWISRGVSAELEKKDKEKKVGENIDFLNAEVQQLQDELDTFRRGAPETKATIVKLETRNMELLNQLQTLNEEKLHQENSLEELFKTHDELSNQYDFECKEREKKEKEVAHLEQQLRQLQAKEGKETATCELEQQIDMLEETINDMSVEKDHYRQELAIKDQCIQQLRKDIEELRREKTTTCSATNNEFERRTQEMDTLRTRLESLSGELESSSKEAETIRSQLHEVEEERDELNQSVELCEENIAVLKIQVDSKTLECEELKQKQQQKQQQQQVMEHSTPNNSQVDIDDQQEEVRNLQNDLDYLEKQYKQVSKENILLKEEFENLVASKTTYQNDLDEIKIKLDQYMKEKSDLKNEIDQFTKLTAKYGYDNALDFDAFVLSLSTDVVTSTQVVQCLTNEKDLLDSKYLELESKIKNENYSLLQSEMALLQTQVLQKDSVIKEINIELKEKMETITEKDGEIEKLHGNLKQIKENNDLIVDKNIEELKKELKEYEDKIQSLNETIESLQIESEQFKMIEGKHVTEMEEKNMLIGELKAQLVDVAESVASEDHQGTDTLQEELYQEKLCEKEDLILQLTQELKETQKFGEDLKMELEGRDTNVGDELQAALEKMEVLQNEVQEKGDAVNELQTALSEKEDTINELNSLLQEKGNKGSKFKNAAVKAKKELEALREKYRNETSSWEEQVANVKEEFNCVEEELTRQKTECSKHEEEFEEFQVEIKNLQLDLEKERDCARNVKESLLAKEEESIELREEVKEKQTENTKLRDEVNEKQAEIAKLKPTIEELQRNLDTAVQERGQHLVKSLEIGDYERTVDNLQNSLDEKEKQLVECQHTIEDMKEVQRNVAEELGCVKKDKEDIETKGGKLKAMIVKLKREAGEKEQQQQQTQQHIGMLDETIEDLKQTVESMKLEATQMNADNINVVSELKNTIEHHEKQYKTLEVKFARATNDLSTAQRENSILAQEFEQYKVRAHNVLKQQKHKQQEDEENDENLQQMSRLEEMSHGLKQKLNDSTDALRELEGRHQELQLEYDGLQARHHEFVEEIGEKELAWRQKIAQVKLDASAKVLEYQDKLQVAQSENENLVREAREQQEEVNAHTEILKNKEKKAYANQIEILGEEIRLLRDEVVQLKRKRQETPPNILELNKRTNYEYQDSVDSRANESLEFDSVSERQQAEGMDSRELEIIDALSQRGSIPHTPSSPSHASILERLLSPAQVSDHATPSTPQSPNAEDVISAKALQTAVKKNEHMTALLRESEANACRLADQAKVLKEEIRRLERNEEREQGVSNMEYLKNVIIKFLKVGSIEKEQLIPVLSTMLKLNDEEKKFIFDFAKGGDGEEGEDSSSWSSYVYRWTSLS